jgi:large subunit ribosomal protein L25
MKSVSMSGSLRANVGKKDAKQLRNNGQVPCVLYGGEKQVSFSVDEKAFKPLVFTPEVHTVDLDLDGQKFQAILQELQTHPVTDKIIHADFVQLTPGKSVTMNLPIKTVGNSAGVKAGGKLLKKLRKVSVRGPIEKMPEHITIDIENLNIGGAVLVRDLKHEGLTFLTPGNSTIVTVQVTRNVVEEPAAGAAKAAAAPAAKK